ncbi:MAG TPA: hypothetical protein PLH92_15600 [Mycobacterium sp.]|uniref:DUF7155 family protein n=1 Tax=Mycolicibacterium sp. TaxID=2320850 RepID=UPI0025DE79ED|nr:hypothetical protein [Mycolicibacterium sp.]HPX38276.1 hypothetical protein [Mycobacterium sp.]HQC78136.1 hypothetical protein [Mycobacterium sp.]
MRIASTRIAVAGALAAAAIASAPLASAEGQCLAWFGSRGEGQCMGYSNGTPTYIGTPNMGVWGPGYGAGLGVVTGPLMPGTTINQGLSP